MEYGADRGVSAAGRSTTVPALQYGNNSAKSLNLPPVREGLPLDSGEPARVAEAAVKHVVITSVTRDDLSEVGVVAFSNGWNFGFQCLEKSKRAGGQAFAGWVNR